MQPTFEKRPVKWLIENISKANICDQFSDSELNWIGQDILELTEVDKNSRFEWADVVDRGLKIAKQVAETKTFPWDGAANSKDPLIAVAAMQFSARANAEVIRGRDVVKSQVTGEDPDGRKERRSKRISTYMSYQCLEEMTEWQSETDQLLMSISPIGQYYKKTYYDFVLERNVSVAVSPLKVIVNENVKDLASAERITEEITDYTRNTVIERIRGGLWRDIEDYLIEDDNGKLHEFLESNCWYDLDGDGYKEPYVITVHTESGQVVRICARYDEAGIKTGKKDQIRRIDSVEYFTEFPFLPSFDGKFHKTGFCQLLTPLVEQINTLQNQIIDAGTLSNVGGGFIGKGAKLPAGGLRFKLNQWIPVESTGASLRDNLFPNPAKEPSAVLFQLLANLNDKAQQLASVNDTMMGDIPGGNVPASTVLASLDQALKVYTGILRRLFRAFQSEFVKLYRLNNLYLTDKQYITVLDLTQEEVAQDFGIDPQMITDESQFLIKKDFNMDDMDVQPVMDPTAASESIRLARANALLQTMPGNPEVLRDYYKAMGVAEEAIDRYIPKQDPNAPKPPDPNLIKLEADITKQKEEGEIKREQLINDAHRLAIDEALIPYKQKLMESQALLAHASAEKALADSEKVQIEAHINVVRQEMAQLQADFDNKLAALTYEVESEMSEYDSDDRGTTGGTGSTADGTAGTSGMDESGADAEGTGMVGQEGPLPVGTDGARSIPLPGQLSENSGGDGSLSGSISRTQPNTDTGDITAAENEPGSMM